MKDKEFKCNSSVSHKGHCSTRIKIKIYIYRSNRKKSELTEEIISTLDRSKCNKIFTKCSAFNHFIIDLYIFKKEKSRETFKNHQKKIKTNQKHVRSPKKC